jgi:lysozyme family protein
MRREGEEMSNFDYALAFALASVNEGEWCNVPGDSGGETYRGIARNDQPRWNGWAIIDGVKANMIKQPAYGTPAYRNWVAYLNKQLAGSPLLQKAVATFYQANFWKPTWDQLDKRVAAKVFDISVNCGATWGPKILQRAAGVKDDGVVGAATILAANHADADLLLAAMVKALGAHYDQIVAANPRDQKFAAGWDARAARLPIA